MQSRNPSPDCVTVALSGELDHYTAPDIRAQMDAILRDPCVTSLLLDMRHLSFMDSSGIGVLLGRLKLLRQRGGGLYVTGMQPSVERLFRLSGLQRVIGIVRDGGLGL